MYDRGGEDIFSSTPSVTEHHAAEQPHGKLPHEADEIRPLQWRPLLGPGRDKRADVADLHLPVAAGRPVVGLPERPGGAAVSLPGMRRKRPFFERLCT